MYSIFTKHKITKSRKSRKSRKSPKSRKSGKSPKSSKIEKFLYPFWHNKIPFPDPGDDLFVDSTWYEHLELAFKMYGKKSSLPKGSILFHGSTVVDPVNTIKPANKSYFFFGLDAFISIWYISELVYKKPAYERDSTPGYLNVYQTLQDIPYKYFPLPHGADDDPESNEACENIACMHPQLGYHIEVNEFLPIELSIEFTIPTNNITNKLKLIGVYVVDVSKLYDNKDKNFDEFKALDAVMFETNLVK